MLYLIIVIFYVGGNQISQGKAMQPWLFDGGFLLEAYTAKYSHRAVIL